MNKSEIFLDHYNKIDAFLKHNDKLESYLPFAQKVKNTKNRVVLRFKDELLSLGELRNAIVHNPRKDGKAIAEPHDDTVRRIVELYGFINNPKKVIPEFQFEIIGSKENDYINQILVEMKENSFSQFPVYDEKTQVLELINTNTIARWLSSEMEKNGTIITENVKVKDLVPFIEFSKNYGYVSRNTSVFEAYELFVNQIIKYKRNLDVLFITHSGKPNEKLLGLITIEDIAHKV